MADDDPIARAARAGLLDETTVRAALGGKPATPEFLVESGTPTARQLQELEAPARLFGSYELKRELGRGGFGVVWPARDPRLDRLVALKILEGDEVERFTREARLAAALSHPNPSTRFARSG